MTPEVRIGQVWRYVDAGTQQACLVVVTCEFHTLTAREMPARRLTGYMRQRYVCHVFGKRDVHDWIGIPGSSGVGEWELVCDV